MVPDWNGALGGEVRRRPTEADAASFTGKHRQHSLTPSSAAGDTYSRCAGSDGRSEADGHPDTDKGE
jgi:hypothetical protein